MRYLLATVAAMILLTAPAMAGTRQQALQSYATEYGQYQEWVPLIDDTEFVKGDFKRSYFKLKFLSNPAPGAANCFSDDGVHGYGYGCPAKWYTGGVEFFMLVEAKVTRCGPGWYVVATPIEQRTCTRLPTWNALATLYHR